MLKNNFRQDYRAVFTIFTYLNNQIEKSLKVKGKKASLKRLKDWRKLDKNKQ